MRTTIDLDEELLHTAKAISQARKQTLSRVIGDLAWKGLRPDPASTLTRNGFPILPPRPNSLPVTSEHVAQLLALADDEDLLIENAG